MVAAEARLHVAAQQSRMRPPFGLLSMTQRLQAEHNSRIKAFHGWVRKTSELTTREALQENGGLTDLWCIDDGDILCRPILVSSYPQALDTANVKNWGAERNPQKTEVIYYLPDLRLSGASMMFARFLLLPRRLAEVLRSE